MKQRLRQISITGFAFALTVCVLAGCLGGNKRVSREDILIPYEDTVREQFALAAAQERDAKGIFDKETRRREIEKTVFAYVVVEERFPDDTKFTPVSAFKVAELRQELGYHREAIEQFDHVLQRWPGDDTVRMTALYGRGKSLDELKRPEEAQVYYKMLIDEFESAPAADVRDLVELARQRYRQIRPRT